MSPKNWSFFHELLTLPHLDCSRMLGEAEVLQILFDEHPSPSGPVSSTCTIAGDVGVKTNLLCIFCDFGQMVR